MPSLLVDTCLAIWLSDDAPIAAAATEALASAANDGAPTYVSPITAWEMGILSSRRRVLLTMPVDRWFEELLARPGMLLASLPPRILIGSSFLPGTPPNDPADRIIAATTLDLGATLLTRDRLLLAYGQQGHFRTIAC